MRSSTFAAFDSQNYPLLVESGIDTSYNEAGLATPHGLVSLSLHKDFDNNVTVLKYFLVSIMKLLQDFYLLKT